MFFRMIQIWITNPRPARWPKSIKDIMNVCINRLHHTFFFNKPWSTSSKITDLDLDHGHRVTLRGLNQVALLNYQHGNECMVKNSSWEHCWQLMFSKQSRYCGPSHCLSITTENPHKLQNNLCGPPVGIAGESGIRSREANSITFFACIASLHETHMNKQN